MVGALRRTNPEEWQVVDELYPALHRFAAVVAPWDLDGDDLLHDALVAVLSKRSLGELHHPGAYLRRVIINLAAGHCRRRGALKRALVRIQADHDCTGEAYPSDLEDLERLPPKQRAILYLAEIERYPYREIARMLECSEAAARKSASRARRRLRAELVSEGLG